MKCPKGGKKIEEELSVNLIVLNWNQNKKIKEKQSIKVLTKRGDIEFDLPSANETTGVVELLFP